MAASGRNESDDEPEIKPSPDFGQSSGSNALYLQVALSAAGNTLAVIICLLVWMCWKVLADFRSALLWAILSSVALRDLREFLVEDATRRLEEASSLPALLLQLLTLPFAALAGVWLDVKWLYTRWRQGTLEYMRNYRRQARKRLVHFTPPTPSGPAGTPAHAGQLPEKQRAEPVDGVARSSNLGPPKGPQQPFKPLQPGFAGSIMASLRLGVQTLRSSGFRKQRTRRRRPAAGTVITMPSTALFRWLLRACVAYQVFLWLWASIALAVQAVLLAVTVTAMLGMPLLLMLSGHWVLSATADAGSSKSAGTTLADTPQKASALPTPRKQYLSGVGRAAGWPMSRCAAVDARLRGLLTANIRGIVSAGLIITTLLAVMMGGAFFAFNIGQESRESLAALRQALPSNWSLPVSETGSPGSTQVQRVLLEYRPQIVEAVGHIVPWVETQLTSMLQAYNLSQVADEVKNLQMSLQEPRVCSSAEMQAALVALAKARAQLRRQVLRQRSEQQKLAVAEASLTAAVRSWQNCLEASTQHPPDQQPSASDQTACAAADDSSTDPSDISLEAGHAEAAADEASIAGFDAKLQSQQAEVHAADAAAEAATSELRQAERRHKLCLGHPAPRLIRQSAAGNGPRRTLQAAYASLSQWQLREGLANLQALASQIMVAASAGLSGSSDTTQLQQLAHTAAEPLLGIGKIIGTSVWSSTSLALAGSIGLVRLFLGIFNFSVQFLLFILLLYALLSAETDPLTYAIQVLPLSDDAREQAAAAFSDALKSVFLSSIKLALFHALFTWLTFRMFNLQLVYLSTMASAVAAALPMIPVWLVAVPAAIQLLAQGRTVSVAMLLSGHVLAWQFADSVIMSEVRGSRRFPTLTSLGVLGGISTAGIQGAFVGPMLLAVAAVAFDLHVRLMKKERVRASSLSSFSRSASVESGLSGAI